MLQSFFRKGYKAVSDHTRWIVQRQDNASSDFHIRLNFYHSGLIQAIRLLANCSECEIVEAAGIVYRFVSVVARDNALHRLRSKLGWMVANPMTAALGVEASQRADVSRVRANESPLTSA
jgi:hypothetical protein